MIRKTAPILALCLAACGSPPVKQPEPVTAVRADMNHAMAAYADNRYAEARNYFGRALQIYRSVDDRSGQLDTLIDLADSALQQGDAAAARSHLDAARDIAMHDHLDDRLPRLALLDAYADLQDSDPKAAADRLDALLAETGTPADVRQAALLARTQAAFNLGASDAAAWLAKTGAAVSGNPDPLVNARQLRLEALAAHRDGDDGKAVALYGKALATYQGAFFRPGIAATHEEWADVLLAQKDWAPAGEHLRRALDVRLWMYDRTHSIRILDNLAKVDTALGDATAAQQDTKLEAYLKDGGDPSQSPPTD